MSRQRVAVGVACVLGVSVPDHGLVESHPEVGDPVLLLYEIDQLVPVVAHGASKRVGEALATLLRPRSNSLDLMGSVVHLEQPGFGDLSEVASAIDGGSELGDLFPQLLLWC